MKDYTMKNIKRTLNDLHPGEEAVIAGYANEISDQFRLLEMGLIVGSKVKFIKNAPFGDPIQIRLRGYDLSLRRNLAKGILLANPLSMS